MSESWMKFYIKRIFLSCYKGVYELKRCLQFVVGVYLFDDQIYKNFASWNFKWKWNNLQEFFSA